MERYTENHYDGNGYYLICSGNCEMINCGDCDILGEIVDRLAAYEDTGLEPEEIEQLKGEVFGLKVDKQELEQYRAIGPIDRLRELAQADREGRCVVLPCKPSDVTVYQLRNKKHACGVGVSPRHVSCASVRANGNYVLHHQGADACLKRDFNKTWFLNEEEAEAALKGEHDG